MNEKSQGAEDRSHAPILPASSAEKMSKDIAKQFPVNPTLIPTGYRVDGNGIWVRKGDKEDSWVMVASTPAQVAAVCSDRHANDWSLVIDFMTLRAELKRIVVSYANVFAKGSTLAPDLAERGLLILPAQEQVFRDFVAKSVALKSMPHCLLTRQLGFSALNDGRLAFVLPKQTLVAESTDMKDIGLIFRPAFDNTTFEAYTAAGSTDDWHEMVTPLLRNPAFLFVFCMSLAAPLLAIAGLDNVMVHLFGDSSTGKTTLEQGGASIWGVALDPQHAGHKVTLIERWNATQNAMELLSATHAGIILFIDELGSNTEASMSIYNFTGGRGKVRMTDVGGMQNQLRWSLFMVSTGELAMADKMEAVTRQRPKVGEIIRAMDIPMAVVSSWGDLSQEEIERIVSEFKRRCGEVYGTVGPWFIQNLLNAYPTETELRQALREAIKIEHASLCDVATAAGYELLSPHVRALRRLALISAVGKWAHEFLQVTQDQVDEAVQRVALAWLEALPPLNEEERIVAQIRDYLTRYQGQIVNYDAVQIASLPSVTRAIAHKDWVLFTESGFAEACEGTPPKVAAKALAAKGILHRERNKLTSRHVLTRLGLPRAPYYAVIIKRLLPDYELHVVDSTTIDSSDYEGDQGYFDGDGYPGDGDTMPRV